MLYSNKEFTAVITSPLASAGASSSITANIVDSVGIVVLSSIPFIEVAGAVYQCSIVLPRGSYTMVARVPWDISDVVQHMNVVDQPLTTVEYLGMRG